jgi:hypothetical protein
VDFIDFIRDFQRGQGKKSAKLRKSEEKSAGGLSNSISIKA